MANLRFQHGLTLIELLIAMTLAVVILAALNSVVTLGLNAQASGRQANELVYQGRFALDRMAARARSTAPKPLTTPPAGTPPSDGTTGDWFSVPGSLVMYCRNSTNKQLVETVVTDTDCTSPTGAVIANNVTAFSAQLPSDAGAVDDPVATLSLTLQIPGTPTMVTLSTSVRLGGGAL